MTNVSGNTQGLDRTGGTGRGGTEAPALPPAGGQIMDLGAALKDLQSLDPKLLENDARALLQRSGVERTDDGRLVVGDSGSSSTSGVDGTTRSGSAALTNVHSTDGVDRLRGADGVRTINAAERLTGAETLRLTPPAPPRIELNSELRQGAESFANNIDKVVNEFLLRGEAGLNVGNQAFGGPGITTASSGLTEGGETPQLDANGQPVLGPDGEPLPGGTSTANPPITAAEIIKQVEDKGIDLDKIIKDLGLPPNATGEDIAKAIASGKIDPASLGIVIPATMNESDMRKIAELTADVLMAIFLKLNITDPNNSVETHNALQELSSDLRQQGIDNAKQQAKVAAETMKEAQKYAEQAKVIGQVISVIMIVVTIVLTIVSFGACAPLLAVALCLVIGGAIIGGVVAQQQGGSFIDGAAMGAGIGSLLMIPIALAAAAAQAAATAAKEVAKTIVDAAKKAAQEAMKKAIEQAGTKTTQVAQEAAKQGVQAGVKAAQEAAKQMGQQLTTQQVQTLTQQLTQQMTQELARAGFDVASQGVQTAIQTGVQEGLREIGQTVSQEVIQKGIQEGMQAAAQETLQKTVQLIATGVQFVGAGTKAGVDYESRMRMADAQLAGNDVKRLRMMSEREQERVEEENEIVKTIMESKNAIVEAVLKMMQAQFATANKLMSAGMSKG